MITTQTAQAAIDVASQLEAKGFYISPVAGTPVAKLNELSTLGEAVSTDLDYTPNVDSIVLASNNWDKESPESAVHQAEINTSAELIAAAVSKHLDFAKNVVNPAIKTVAESVTKIVEEASNGDKFNIDIVVVDLPDPIIPSSFEELVSPFTGKGYDGTETYVPLNQTPTAEQIVEMCRTGNGDIDEGFSIWVAKKGSGYIESIWQSAFGSDSQVSVQSLMADVISGVDAATVTFIACTKLYDNPPEGVQLSLAEYNDRISLLKQQAATRILAAYNDLTRNQSTGLMILNYNRTQVFVNGPVYREWVENGGNVSAIYGSVTNERAKLFVSEINENMSELIGDWERRSRFLMSTITSKMTDIKQEALYNAVMNEAHSDMQKYFGHFYEGVPVTVDSAEYVQFKELLAKKTKYLKESDFSNLYKVVTSVVCDSLFYYTDAKLLLTGIEEAVAVNPNMELREALLISTIEYVALYVCDQLVINKQ